MAGAAERGGALIALPARALAAPRGLRFRPPFIASALTALALLLHAASGGVDAPFGRSAAGGAALMLAGLAWATWAALQFRRAGTLRFEGLAIDLDRRSVQRQGQTVELTSTEFELLVLLATTPGKVYHRDDILARLRGQPGQDIHSRAVDILVSRLRKKLEPLDAIHTLRNAGYLFAGVRV